MQKYGPEHHRWKGGRTVNKKTGYVFLSLHGIQKSEHRWVMEQHLGRPLLRTEHVHHIDRNPQNNAIENLVLCPGGAAEHLGKVHRKTFLSETEKECSRCHKILPLSRFRIRPERSSGYRSQCKDCDLLRDKTPERLKYRREWMREYSRRNQVNGNQQRSMD